MAESAAAAGQSSSARKSGVPVFVMMPLDTVKTCCGSGLNHRKTMARDLAALKSSGVEGIMVDVWWGVVEGEEPGLYNFEGYMKLVEMARDARLKVQAVMSFHQCGGNVGDTVNIPLPRWVVEDMDKDQDLAYTDQCERRSYEYVSFGCDDMPVLDGRTPIQCYTDFMSAFHDHFAAFLGNTIVEVQVGMGPAGELRYPSYPESEGTWEFPGIGAFQCYDKAGVGLAGENALPRYDDAAHDQVVATAQEERMVAFTYLRMGPDLFQPDNWRRFALFVTRMSQAR
ncbi:unnamed protein product [Triticum turgidum subsp. durum]|uniref:Beta-amylase n=1 Tax=Triticum turgidum subsp. durum TaxID=4567 RepID=A0A9R0UUV5_TRITD|nr:unnamed protein product [Triticum turgidum subsp. durum]